MSREELVKRMNFWEQGKEVQPMAVAHAIVTHYHGMFTVRRDDGRPNFSRYITCEAATPDRKRYIRLGFEWDITEQITEEMKAQANTVALTDNPGAMPSPPVWLDALPLPALLLDRHGAIKHMNQLVRDRFITGEEPPPVKLIDLVSPPWHVNISSFMKFSLDSAQTSRSLRCNLVDAAGESFPAELHWRRIQHDETPLQLVLIIDLSDSQLTARVVEKMAEHERRTMGQEIHDTIGQNASAISMILSTVRINRALPPDLKDVLHSAEDAARNILTKARHLSRGLLAHSIGQKGLVPALRELADEMQRMKDWACRVEGGDTAILRRDTAVAVYRIAREAAINAMRHSGASALHFRLQQKAEWLNLTIEDDGCGLPEDYELRGFGISSMRQTALSVGGCISIGNRPEGGAAISCAVPVQA